ncbi:MAG TPA: metal-dependent transcriptional regulator [Actinomycetota bacterium]|nr:metal-dependent transcriptional regulator [Actinomycetota bacterium]
MAAGGSHQEDYLEAIFEMAEEGIPTQQARIAEWLGVTPASVSEAVKRLVQRRLVEVGGDRHLTFTDEGRGLAETLVRRHRLAERFLVEVVGLPWYLSHEEATVWGRAISDSVEERFTAVLDDPATCVHGNPIPGSARKVDQEGLRPLHELEPGTSGRLERLTEDLELDLDVMRFLQDSGLMPGARLTVDSVGPDGTRTLEVNGARVALGPEIADNLWVRAS